MLGLIPYAEDFAKFDMYRKFMKQGNAWVNNDYHNLIFIGNL